VHRVKGTVGEHAVRGLEAPWALEQRVVPMGVGKPQNNRPRAGLGFRVYKPKVSRVNREKLKMLYDDVVNYVLGVVHELKGSKYLTYYADEWKKDVRGSEGGAQEGGEADAAESSAATPAR
jgi:hypothetical protein